uniref:C2H2-type domain-containing protein n=1 Tax=Caenorhabditis tropicalis TaxID=1561998 RepID=A0A1I7SZ00_9PELO
MRQGKIEFGIEYNENIFDSVSVFSVDIHFYLLHQFESRDLFVENSMPRPLPVMNIWQDTKNSSVMINKIATEEQSKAERQKSPKYVLNIKITGVKSSKPSENIRKQALPATNVVFNSQNGTESATGGVYLTPKQDVSRLDNVDSPLKPEEPTKLRCYYEIAKLHRQIECGNNVKYSELPQVISGRISKPSENVQKPTHHESTDFVGSVKSEQGSTSGGIYLTPEQSKPTTTEEPVQLRRSKRIAEHQKQKHRETNVNSYESPQVQSGYGMEPTEMIADGSEYFDSALSDLKRTSRPNDLFESKSFDDDHKSFENQFENLTKEVIQNTHVCSPRAVDNLDFEPRQCRDSPLPDNGSFNEELHKQQMKHAKELDELREERRRKQKIFEEELNEIRRESKQRLEILMKCILMKHRFEEQENYWKDWIQGCKKNVTKLSTKCYDFIEDVRLNRGIVDDLETGFLSSQVMIAYNSLQYDFESLKKIEEKCPDSLFVRVLQKCLADVAKTILDIYNATEKFRLNKTKHLENLQDAIGILNPHKIYSTSELRRICENASSSYENVEFPVIESLTKVYEYD